MVFGGVALVVLAIDQVTKYLVRTNTELHSLTLIPGLLAFRFTTNPGMALGIHWAETWIISLIAIVATLLILFYVWRTMHAAGMAYMVCMGLVIGGALGNITDRLFLARIGGYGSFLDGHVVDFIHFKLRIGDFDVFPYIFNVADSAITIAIFTLILFYKTIVPHHDGGAGAAVSDTSGPERGDEHGEPASAGSSSMERGKESEPGESGES